MKKLAFTYFFALLILGLNSCTVDYDLAPSESRNELRKFIFFKAEINGNSITKNLSLYRNSSDYWSFTHSFPLTNYKTIDRSYRYAGSNDMRLPYYNYFDDISKLNMVFKTKTKDLPGRVGTTMAMEDNGTNTSTDNVMGLHITYRGVEMSYKYTSTDSIRYLEIKDTTIDGREYELSHFQFSSLMFTDDNSIGLAAKNVELRQVALKD